jgi:hypothetical protein
VKWGDFSENTIRGGINTLFAGTGNILTREKMGHCLRLLLEDGGSFALSADKERIPQSQ